MIDDKPKAVIYTNEQLQMEILYKREYRPMHDVFEEEMAEFSLTPMEHAERLIVRSRRYQTVHDANMIRLENYNGRKAAKLKCDSMKKD